MATPAPTVKAGIRDCLSVRLAVMDIGCIVPLHKSWVRLLCVAAHVSQVGPLFLSEVAAGMRKIVQAHDSALAHPPARAAVLGYTPSVV